MDIKNTTTQMSGTITYKVHLQYNEKEQSLKSIFFNLSQLFWLKILWTCTTHSTHAIHAKILTYVKTSTHAVLKLTKTIQRIKNREENMIRNMEGTKMEGNGLKKYMEETLIWCVKKNSVTETFSFPLRFSTLTGIEKMLISQFCKYSPCL